MGQVRHGSATTTHAVRAAIQRSQASLATLSRDLGINPKTVAKWRKRQTVEDLKTGPREPRSTILTEAEEATIVAFRRHTLLPLDDCLYALQPSIPHLTRSALHRCLQRHGISRLPDVEGDKPKRQKFKRYPIGFFHIDIAEVQTAEGKLFLFVGIDRTSKFAVTQLVDKADRKTAWEFLQHMLEAVPYQVHTILTDNGIQFAEQPRNRNTVYSRPMRFDMICEANGIEHRLTKPNHPWSLEDQKTVQWTVFPTIDLAILASALCAMLARKPFPIAEELDPGAVHQQVQRTRRTAVRYLHRDARLPTAQGRKVRHRPVETGHR